MFYFNLGEKIKKKNLGLEKAVHRKTFVMLKPSCFTCKSEKFLCAPSLIRANYQLAITIHPQIINQKLLST